MKHLALLVLAGCSLEQLDLGLFSDLTPDPRDVIEPLPDAVPAPADNPTTPEAVELGRLLFWDPVLSGDRDIACATCHHPDFGYADGLEVSRGTGGRGVGPTRVGGARALRNAPTVLATGWNGFTLASPIEPERAPMFWDHRTESLELQVLGPLLSDVEMRGQVFTRDEILDEITARLGAIPEYASRFEAAYRDEGITPATVGKAIAAFERTLVPRESSFDRYLAGDDDAMSAVQIRGLRGFIDGGCARCHSGPLLTDFALHVLPVATRPGDPVDLGDGEHRFRTPSLRMVTITGPWMHNGSLSTLDEILDFYHNISVTDPLLGGDVEFPLGGTEDLRAFFDALSDATYDRTIPERVPSGLPPGGS